MVLRFPILADYCILEFNNRLIYATHGHNHNMENLPPLQKGDILLHGHTHSPAWESFGDENLYFNPGSVSIPKENTKNGYMTLQNNTVLFKALDGTVYHSEML